MRILWRIHSKKIILDFVTIYSQDSSQGIIVLCWVQTSIKVRSGVGAMRRDSDAVTARLRRQGRLSLPIKFEYSSQEIQRY